MPSFNLSDPHVDLQLFAVLGTLIVGSVAIVYSLLSVGERHTAPVQVHAHLRAGLIAACLVVVLAILDICLSVTLS